MLHGLDDMLEGLLSTEQEVVVQWGTEQEVVLQHNKGRMVAENRPWGISQRGQHTVQSG